MARPTTKETLQTQSAVKFDALMQAVADEQWHVEFPQGTLNRNLRDVLGHLHHWHVMLLEWYRVGMEGQKAAMPAAGYKWSETPALNRWIWEQYRQMPLTEVALRFRESHQAIMEHIAKHSDAELFTKGYYSWTGSTHLASYFISGSCSHYDWALKLLKRAIGFKVPKT